MNRNDLRHADINLLVVFETMMRERTCPGLATPVPPDHRQQRIEPSAGPIRRLAVHPHRAGDGAHRAPRKSTCGWGPALEGIAVALSCARVEGLRAEYAPLPLSNPDLSMAWRCTGHAAPRERWLRSCFARHLERQPERSRSLAVA